jgi:hypothetical protein
MKRALTAVDPDPPLNFWRLFHGNQLDIAVLEWCKVFGSDAEPTHWKKVVPTTGQDAFRASMLAELGINAGAWTAYWEEMKAYRDSLIAHHFEVPRLDQYPDLGLALKSAYFYYRRLIGELRDLGENKYPDDLAEYSKRFEAQAIDIARRAVAATKDMKEQVL